MKSRAAVAFEAGKPLQIVEIDVAPPRAGEVLIKISHTGVCHTDAFTLSGDDPEGLFPVIFGHEGAGVVDAVGEDVTRVAVGDHVVCSFIPACGMCRYCSTGQQNLCNAGKNAGTGMFPDGTFRFHLGDEDLGGLCVLGTFSQYAVVHEWSCIRIPKDIPFDVAALVGCGGWIALLSGLLLAETLAGGSLTQCGCFGPYPVPAGVRLWTLVGLAFLVAAAWRGRSDFPGAAHAP